MIEAAAKAIMNIGRASGRNAKLDMLKKYKDIVGFKEILQFIYNPYIRTGIAKKKLDKANSTEIHGYEWPEIIDYFTKHQTGSDNDATIAKSFVNQFPTGSDEHLVAVAMVTKTLKIGITEKSLNQIYGDDFIPMIGIMKAEKYPEYKDKVKGPFIATEKLDGARRVVVKENDVVSVYSRSGIPDDGLVDIEDEARHLPDNCMYDGELLAVGEFENAIELRQATNSIANSKGKRSGLTFNIFDMVPIADYKRGLSTHDAHTRKLMLGAMFGDESIECLSPDNYKQIIEVYKLPHDFTHIKSVPIEGVALTEDDVNMLVQPIWNRGGEGLMLNTFKGLYDMTKDRSRDILKVKNVEEFVLTVIDVEEGKPGTINEGRLGALVVDYKGYRVGVGSGIDQRERISWWNTPSKIIGKQIEIESFGQSQNKHGGISLNCPIFKRIVGHE